MPGRILTRGILVLKAQQLIRGGDNTRILDTENEWERPEKGSMQSIHTLRTRFLQCWGQVEQGVYRIQCLLIFC